MSKHHNQNNRFIPQDPEVEEMIRNKAYELYQKRGYQHGRDLDDWLEAERMEKSRTSYNG